LFFFFMREREREATHMALSISSRTLNHFLVFYHFMAFFSFFFPAVLIWLFGYS
jgi:hypothetical protein